ncbi:keratin, type I cytoskeletal 18-like isoform X2 [Betta splendens]|uniref:Keratin, type I cytoskeletal 18-like isoform X2 n=1 Tax=Betta splendens TaxID=158456 RepID=A0A6P7LCU4_BETSP|nr:keratin, type I cytoskeletal 18-like isoform X2 [Betta splendens]
MSRNSSASMYAGYPSGGRRTPASSPGGLRSLLANDTHTDSAPVAAAAAAAPVTRAEAPAPPVAPEDDKEKMRGLNNRLTSYLDMVKTLQQTNDGLRKQIDEILAKRQAPNGRDWDEVQKPFDDLRKQIKEITMDNANLLMDANNAKLANEDLKNKLDAEIVAQKTFEKELDDVKKVLEEVKQQKESIKKETEMVKDEIDRIKQEHKDMVDDLCEKIRTSKVTVEIEPDKNNLTSVIDNMRNQYEKIAQKNLKETEDWYKDKFENIKVVEAENSAALESGNADLKDKQKQKQQLEIQIQSVMTKIQTLEALLENTKIQCSKRLSVYDKEVQNTESEIKKVRSQMERQKEDIMNLMSEKLKLEEEIRKYNDLMNMCSDERKVEA